MAEGGEVVIKKRSILFDRVRESAVYGERMVIGLFGSHRGAGVTHTGLMLAFYFGEELGKKTALLECNSHRDLELIRNAYHWNEETSGSFGFHQITCYPNVGQGQIRNVCHWDYECILMDYGTEYPRGADMKLQPNVCLILGGSAQWELQKLLQFWEKCSNTPERESWTYLIPGAKNSEITKMRSIMGRRVWAIPSHREPTIATRELNRFWSRLF